MSIDSSELNLSYSSFESVDYWKQHFDPSCTISMQYYVVEDGTKLLTVHAENPNGENSRPVIVVAGWFSLIDGWTDVMKEISKKSSIFYIETREKASSILPDHHVDMSVERMTDDFADLCKQMPLDVKESVVVASSMGGTIMLEYLGRMENLPNASILIGPNPEFDVPQLLVKSLLLLPIFGVRRMKWFVKWYIKTFKIDMKKEPAQYTKYANVLDNAHPWKIKYSGKGCLWYKAWDILEQATIENKVILVGASSDKMHGAKMTQKIQEYIPDAEYVDFPSNKATHSSEMGQFILKYT